MSEKAVIKKGDYFVVTTGEYSNYQIDCVSKAVKDFCIDDLILEYLVKNPLDSSYPYLDVGEFTAWFFGLGISVFAKCTEINVNECKPYLNVEEI